MKQLENVRHYIYYELDESASVLLVSKTGQVKGKA